MKKVDISRLEHDRSTNLRIGFAAALCMAILAFNWTVQRAETPTFQGDGFSEETEVKIVRTAHKTPAAKPPPALFKITDKILELPTVAFDPNPISLPIDSFISSASTGSVGQPIKPAVFVPPLPAEGSEHSPPFLIVEEMPRFPGCQEDGLSKKEKQECATERLLKYLGEEIRYPAIARENGIEGTVVVRFIVEKDGSISQPVIMREIGGGCGAEALRVVKSMPQWLPGKQQGRPVRVQFSLPVQYKLGR